MVSKWIMQESKGSTCPSCKKKTVDLLCPASLSVAFYICWTCKTIAEVGIGPVIRDPNENSEAPH
jgi:DNA-directed RNA polymerase subunit RPC12/RpoP